MLLIVKFTFGLAGLLTERQRHSSALKIFMTLYLAIFLRALSVEILQISASSDWSRNGLVAACYFPSLSHSTCCWRGLTMSKQQDLAKCSIETITNLLKNIQVNVMDKVEKLPCLAPPYLQCNTLPRHLSLGVLSNIEVLLFAKYVSYVG